MFLYCLFETPEEAEEFCSNHFPNHLINDAKFIIEGSDNIIVIFDSDKSKSELATEFYSILTPDIIKFYFLYEIDKLITANIPETMKEFIFNHKKKVNDDKGNLLIIDFKKPKFKQNDLNLDEILEKIDQNGVESLTTAEKDFLDNFNKN